MKGKANQQCMTHSVYKLPRPVKVPASMVVILLSFKFLWWMVDIHRSVAG
jgi:hypothetical protein